jgi:hypothetical protein
MWETFAQSMYLSHNVFYGLDEAEAWLAETS